MCNPSLTSFHQCIWHNSPYITNEIDRSVRPVINVEPIREKLQEDPHLLLHMESDFFRCTHRRNFEDNFEETYSIMFPVCGFSPPIPRPAGTLSGRIHHRELKLVSFNPKRPVIAVVFSDYGTQTLGIYAISGRERGETGSLLYFYSGAQLENCHKNERTEMKISWSPNGTKLLCIQPQVSSNGRAVVTVFTMDVAGKVRRIHCPAIPLVSYFQNVREVTAECWSSDDTFWIQSVDEFHDLTKIKILEDAVVVEPMREVPIIVGPSKANNMGVFVNDSTAFWFQKCRQSGHLNHTLIRRQSLESPRTKSDTNILAITFGYVTSAALNVGDNNSLLVVLFYPDGIHFECPDSTAPDSDYMTTDDIDESVWPFAGDAAGYKYGTNCKLAAPWIQKKLVKKHKVVLASVNCFDDKIDFMSVVHSARQVVGFNWPENFTKPPSYQIVGQTDRYALVSQTQNLSFVFLMSKITNLCIEIHERHLFAPNIDGSLVVNLMGWYTNGTTYAGENSSPPLRAASTYDAKPASKKQLAMWSSECRLDCNGQWMVSWYPCPYTHKDCHLCNEVRRRRQKEEYNEPKVLPAHITDVGFGVNRRMEKIYVSNYL